MAKWFKLVQSMMTINESLEGLGKDVGGLADRIDKHDERIYEQGKEIARLEGREQVLTELFHRSAEDGKK